MPIEFSHEHQLWAQECISRLELALEQSRSFDPTPADASQDDLGFRWPEPDDLLAALLLADELLELADARQRLGSHPTARAVAQHGIGMLGHWLSELVRSTGVTYDEETERLVQLLAAQKASKLYVLVHGLELRQCEGVLLQAILSSKIPTAIRVGIDLLVQHPPKAWTEASQAIGALVQSHHWRISDVFPRLLDATTPSVLAPALDLANMQVRKLGVQPHPAAERFDSLLSLTGSVTQQLASLEENPNKFAGTVAEVQRILFDSVSLLVSLCDYLGLMGDPRAIGKLTQALDLRHRRIKAEAAFALAKLGEERAKELLVEMVSDDACRLRVLAYATELGIEEKIDTEWTNSLSTARADLALWLSQPEQFSIPPHDMTLIEQRTLPWPGFEGPQECFLLRFQYRLGEEKHENIAFSGPFPAAVAFDLTGLSNDQCYELFLANDVEDASERRMAWSQLTSREQSRADEAIEGLRERGYHDVTPKGVFEFLGRRSVFCEALNRSNHPTHILADEAFTRDDSPSLSLDDSDAESPLFTTKPSAVSADFLYLRWKGKICMELLEQD
jgi:hypothetical protein